MEISSEFPILGRALIAAEQQHLVRRNNMTRTASRHAENWTDEMEGSHC